MPFRMRVGSEVVVSEGQADGQVDSEPFKQVSIVHKSLQAT